MKFLVVLCSALACAVATPGLVGINGFGYGYSAISPYAAPVAYSAPVGYSAPVAYSAPVPVAHAAHVAVAHAAPVAVAHAAPVAVATAAVAAPAVVKSQYHAQDELGQASYGHNEPLQTHHAAQDAAGNKVGSFSHVAPNGQVFRTDYVADALGYRVASNALPVGPSAVPVAVADTPEVVAARAAHLAHHVTAVHRVRRGIVAAAPVAVAHSAIAVGHTPAATAPLATSAVAYGAAPIAYGAAPIAYGAAPIAYGASPIAYGAAPITYSSAVSPVALAREGILTQVVNNPGHAVSYRVD